MFTDTESPIPLTQAPPGLQEPRIVHLPEKILVGMYRRMSVTRDQTGQLWRDFMPRRHAIGCRSGTSLYSLRVYGQDFFRDPDRQREYEKWAAVEVAGPGNLPEGMATIRISGHYAVFPFRGQSRQGHPALEYIYLGWLPDSGLRLEERPHFDLLGEDYRPGDPGAREGFRIPVRA